MPNDRKLAGLNEIREGNLVDQKGLQGKDIYLYKITNHQDKGFIKEQTLSVLHLSPITNAIYGVRVEEQQSLTQETKENNSKGNTAVFVPRTSGMQYTTGNDFDDGGSVLIASFEPITIINGSVDTELYFVDDIVKETEKGRKVHGKPGLSNKIDFTLSNVKDITNNYNALKFLYTFTEEIKNPNELDISMNNYSLLSKIMAKGEVDNKKHQDIDLEIDETNSSKLSLLKMTPTSTNYKLSNFSDWLDANRTLSFVKAKTFISKTNLKTLFDATNADFAGWSATEINDAYKVVIGMMKLTKAYATNFSEYRTAADGKIDGNATINGIKLVDFADKNPINAVDGMVEAWKGNYPGQVDTAGFKIMLEVIVMLSNHINSSYAVSKGNNDFHKVAYPWYFVPQTAINKSLADDDDFEVILKSEYFNLNKTAKVKDYAYLFKLPASLPSVSEISDLKGNLAGRIMPPPTDDLEYVKISQFPNVEGLAITPGTERDFDLLSIGRPNRGGVRVEITYDSNFPLLIKDEYKDISGYIAHDLNGFISQAELPNKITPINKFARPGDIDLKSDNDLKYLFYIPYTDEQVLENLYGELHTPVQTGWHEEGISRNYKQTFSLYSVGTDDVSAPPVPTITKSDALALLNLATNQRTDESRITNLAVINISQSNGRTGTGGYGNGEYTYVKRRGQTTYTVVFDYTLETNGSQTISSIQHKGTIYDKLNWRSVSNSLTNGSDVYKLALKPNHKFKLNIDKINEINIQSVWLDEVSIVVSNGTDILQFDNIELPSIDDETLTNFTILI